MIDSLILRPNIVNDYSQAFDKWAVYTLYGSDILIGSEIASQYKDEPTEGESES